MIELVDSLNMNEDHLLKVKDKEGNSKLFIDFSVYSKNRNFRVLGSSKFGEIRPLTVSPYSPTPGSKKAPYQSQETQEYEKMVFLNSLITNISPDEAKESRIIQPNPDQVPTKTVCVSTSASRSGTDGHHHSKICTNVPSPTEIDQIVAELVKPGTVRRISFMEEAETFRYDVKGQKFCKKIGREHSTNHIFYTYYRRHRKLFQDCYSPSCRTLDAVEIDLEK